jgi:hypothetical protein
VAKTPPPCHQILPEDFENSPAQSDVGSGQVFHISELRASEWEPVVYFRDALFSNPNCDVHLAGSLIHEPYPDEMNPLRSFLCAHRLRLGHTGFVFLFAS